MNLLVLLRTGPPRMKCGMRRMEAAMHSTGRSWRLSRDGFGQTGEGGCGQDGSGERRFGANSVGAGAEFAHGGEGKT